MHGMSAFRCAGNLRFPCEHKRGKMAYVVDLKKMCQKCGKKRVIEIGDALYVAKVGKAVAQREFCFCG